MAHTRAVTLSWIGKGRDVSPDATADPGTLGSWHAPDGSGCIYHGDNLTGLRRLARTHSGAFALAYLDPPFFTNREHIAWLRKAGAPRSAARVRVPAFDDRWPDLPSWLEALGQRLTATRELVAAHGSIVVHVDPKTSHYVRVLGDEVFGPDAFASEIVWRYRRWPTKTPNFQRVHDVLLRWRRDPRGKPRYNQLYESLAPSTVATWGTHRQRAVFTGAGRRVRSSSTLEKTAGTPMGDVWDIGVIAPIARERTGYPSQKPEALLERLLSALSDPGDLVLDPYAGSGTTLAVAHRMQRPFVGLDASRLAIETTRARFEALGAALVPADADASSSPVACASPRTS